MRDYLPPIYINVPGSRRLFLANMARIAKELTAFIVEQHFDALGQKGFDVVNLRHTGESSHEGLGAQLIVQPEERRTVAVEIRAAQWYPEDPPSYATYVAQAKTLIGPCLSAYNRENHTRLRMTVVSREKLEPRLPTQSAKLFKHFADLANKSGLHALDWGRFYEFVRYSRMRKRLSDEDMGRLLVREGFAEQYAEHIAEIYGHLWQFRRNS